MINQQQRAQHFFRAAFQAKMVKLDEQEKSRSEVGQAIRIITFRFRPRDKPS
jgi:hypothetical protein